VSDPKDPEHFAAFESDRPAAEPERAITPFHKFDSRPKLAVAPRVADPLANVPRLFPRDPKSPSEFERLRQERAARDTEPAAPLDADELDDAEAEAEITSAERPFERRVLRRLYKLEKSDKKRAADLEIIKKSSQDAAQHALEMLNLVKVIDKRQRDFDLERRWVPWAFRVVTLGLALWALIRTYR